MIPDFQTLLRPVLQSAEQGEVKMRDVVRELGQSFELTEEELNELLPSGKAKRFENRVHWARFHLKEAGLLESPRRGVISITETGRQYLQNGPERITLADLKSIDKTTDTDSRNSDVSVPVVGVEQSMTPDELMRAAHAQVIDAVASDLLDRVRNIDPGDFEELIVLLLSKMGYGYSDHAGRVLGGAGDDGVDGVINLDPLGVDQVYVQAKRYGADNTIGSGPIRDFYGALGLKDVTKGIFVTTSTFSANARSTAEKLGARLVLIDGPELARLMVRHEVGCRVTETFKVSVVEESYFE